MKSKTFKGIFVGLLFLYFIYCVFYLFVNRQKYQWDFQMQYHAAKFLAEGKNPYDFRAETGNPRHYYAYPPATLWFYRLFTWAEYDTAYNIFLLLKTAAIIGLVLLWRIKFIGKLADTGFYFFCLLAFNSTMFLDMRAGNINMLEELMLWLGFYFFLEHRLILFCCFILLGASFKMTPLVFLGLLLLTDNKKRFVYLFGSCIAFLSYLLIQYAAAPQMFRAFINAAKFTLSEQGIISPSTIGILKDIFNILSKISGIPATQALQYNIFCVIAAAIIIVSGRAYFILKSLKMEDKEKMTLFLVCLVYALIHPRLKDYACMLLIVPSYFIIKKCGDLKIYPFLFVLASLAVTNISLPGSAIIYGLLWNYYPLVIAYLIWGLYIYEIFITGKQQRAAQAVPILSK